MKAALNVMNKTTILVVDDEPQLRKLLRRGLSSYEYEVTAVPNGTEAIAWAAHNQPDLIVLDISLGSTPDGLEVCNEIRGLSTTPIIMLTVNDDKNTLLAALNAGADDYLTKPFDMDELEARIRAVLRRSASADTQIPNGMVQVHDLIIDLVKRRVTLKGDEIHLTPREYKLLCALATHPGKVLTFDNLIEEIKGDTETVKPEHYVRVYINTLRKKLHDDPSTTMHPLYIFSVPGVGYRFTDLQPIK